MEKLANLTPTPKDAGAAGLGAALGILLVWLIGFQVDVPAEPAVAIGTITTWLSVKWFG